MPLPAAAPPPPSASDLLTIAALRARCEAGLSCNVLNIGPAGLIVGDAGTAPADRHDGDQLVTGTADHLLVIASTSTSSTSTTGW